MNMKTPTWAIVVGICLMLFGGCSVTKNIQAISMPQMLETQKDLMETMSSLGHESLSDTTITDSGNIPNMDVLSNVADGMQKMFAVSDFTLKWTVIFGYVGLFVSVVYILSGVFLIIRKKYSINLVYLALTVNIVLGVIQSIVLASDSSGGIIAMSAGFSNIFGIIVDLILIVIVLTMDKSTYFKTSGEIA